MRVNWTNVLFTFLLLGILERAGVDKELGWGLGILKSSLPFSGLCVMRVCVSVFTRVSLRVSVYDYVSTSAYVYEYICLCVIYPFDAEVTHAWDTSHECNKNGGGGGFRRRGERKSTFKLTSFVVDVSGRTLFLISCYVFSPFCPRS